MKHGPIGLIDPAVRAEKGLPPGRQKCQIRSEAPKTV